MSEAEAEAGPVPFMVGTYAIFAKPDGGICLALREQNGTEHQLIVPGFMVEMYRQGETGLSPLDMIKAVRATRKSRRALTNNGSRETLGGDS